MPDPNQRIEVEFVPEWNGLFSLRFYVTDPSGGEHEQFDWQMDRQEVVRLMLDLRREIERSRRAGDS